MKLFASPSSANHVTCTFLTRYIIRGFKLLFALAVTYDLKIEQIDVKTAFLYGEINVNICDEPRHHILCDQGPTRSG
jgi:hypothetical protein